MHPAVIAVLRGLVLTGATCLLAATVVDEFQSARSNNATVTYGAYKTTVDVPGVGAHTSAARCGSEGNDVSQLNSSDVGAICNAVCTTKKVAVVVPVVLAFIGVALLTAYTGHGWKSPAYPPASRARWRGAAWCGMIAAVVYGIVLGARILPHPPPPPPASFCILLHPFASPEMLTHLARRRSTLHPGIGFGAGVGCVPIRIGRHGRSIPRGVVHARRGWGGVCGACVAAVPVPLALPRRHRTHLPPDGVDRV